MQLWHFVLIGVLAFGVMNILLVSWFVESIGFSSMQNHPPPLPDSSTVSGLDGVRNSFTNTANARLDDIFERNYSEAYLSAAQALYDRDYNRVAQHLDRCNVDDGACVGLRAEIHLVGAGVPRNLTEALNLFQEGANLGDADSQYALGVIYSNLFEDVNHITASGHPALKRSEALTILHLYAASVAGHEGALMAMGYRHLHGYGVRKSCPTAALNYIEVARRVAAVYTEGMPQAVELVRLGVDGRDAKAMSASEVSLFVELAASGDANIAAAVGKRYLLGIDGFRQNYTKAARHLQVAAEKNHAGAMALLGYMHYLGLGAKKNLELAYSYFVSSSLQDDAIGHNGLGYFYFHGHVVAKVDMSLSFKHFNASAYGGSSDGMFNLGSMYLTGSGVAQSLSTAMTWFTHAVDRGHTPAAYTVAIMYLNGVGAVRNCKLAVELLKRVCERDTWVAEKLQQAYDHKDDRPDSAAWLFMRLAEAGHEVAQMNLAHLLDSGSARLLDQQKQSSSALGAVPSGQSIARNVGDSDTVSDNVTSIKSSQHDDAAAVKARARTYAQRHYEMSAEQGNVLSDLRLGDYAYYGWGVRLDTGVSSVNRSDEVGADGDEPEMEELFMNVESEVLFVPQEVDFELSLAHYKRTASTRISGEWMQPFVARASFNLGFMHHFGIGVIKSASAARQHYRRCFEVDPTGVRVPVSFMTMFLAIEIAYESLPPARPFARGVLADVRTHILLLEVVAAFVLMWIRRRIIWADQRQGAARLAAVT
eukprot:TRINITY_DN32008_c0_g1_i1.p1 TRINITY_DN32008_c0_g1~~TRINITY_DN32008_c0_g1_i1.p1  ORF type:complete len:762 (+),score=99.66 TRINITY_DN32008_c0_g1_i1:95-2380(+)